MLTDPFAIDILIHYGGENPIQLILYYDEEHRSKNALKAFFVEHGAIAKKAFDQRIQLRWVVKDTPNYSRFTQMQAKTVITDTFCLTVSYNLSCPARCANWEHLVALNATDSDRNEFDALWGP